MLARYLQIYKNPTIRTILNLDSSLRVDGPFGFSNVYVTSANDNCFEVAYTTSIENGCFWDTYPESKYCTVVVEDPNNLAAGLCVTNRHIPLVYNMVI